MKERPILFTGEMVRAILDGRKTQTRRPMKIQPHEGSKLVGMTNHHGEPRVLFWCEGQPSSYGTSLPMRVGDRLWVRETWSWSGVARHHLLVLWQADREYSDEERRKWIWRPSTNMPRWASRIDLEITAVRVERVQDITEEDAKKEGVNWTSHVVDEVSGNLEPYEEASDAFKRLWQSIYGNRPNLPANTQSKRYKRVIRWLEKNPPTDWDANPWVWVYEFRRIKP